MCVLLVSLLLGTSCSLPISVQSALTAFWLKKGNGDGVQWSAEANALITTFFFGWLVGPLERKPVEVRRHTAAVRLSCLICNPLCLRRAINLRLWALLSALG